MPRPVVLLTDFGTSDPFVGLMKCVIEARCPGATVIDLCHDVPPQAVAEATFWLSRSVRFLPRDAVCVAVVDPGVGTERRAIVVESEGRCYVGPDNGLLSFLMATAGSLAWEVDTERLGLAVESATFHGRDVFAPVGAELAAGRWHPSAVGPRASAIVEGALSTLELRDGAVTGEVVVVDRFGNLITNIDGDVARELPEGRVEVADRLLPLHRTYADVESGQLVALESSFGTLEIARRGGSAGELLGLGRGSRVVWRR